MNMIGSTRKKRASSMLGLSFDGNRLEAVVLKNANGSLQALQTLSAPLALSPLSGDPALVGHEIRNLLDQSGVRERNCIVCLPLNWVMSLGAKIPEIPNEDVADFLDIEAERGFHSGHENLIIAQSHLKLASGERFATLMGIPRNHIEILEQALKAAQLKPVGFTLGLCNVVGDPASASPSGSLTLVVASHGVELQVTAGGGIAALRSLDNVIETEGAQRKIDVDELSKELRITLGQLAPEISGTVTTAKVIFRGEMARQNSPEIIRRLQGIGLRVEPGERLAEIQMAPLPVQDMALSYALAGAARALTSQVQMPEFLPPKVKPWQNLLSTGMSSKKLLWVGSAAGAIAGLVILAFAVQQIRIMILESRWRKIQPQVAQLQDAQEQIHKFRPWYDNSVKGLRILRSITEAFPEDGSLATAKTLDVKNLTTVSCTGVARNNQSYLGLLDKLRATSEISDLKTEMIRGQSPVQFTLNFTWEGGEAHGN